MKLHVNRGRASGHRSRRMDLANSVDEMPGQREVCSDIDRAPQIPIAGTSVASPFGEEKYVDLLFLGDAAARHATAVFSKYFL